ncbi:MAG: hypothetical protein MJ197_00300 [Bacteroidales bacterium]|nr:hypothetical protein [Bacteroidales bacterium]
MDNQKFNQVFKVAGVSLLVIAVLVTAWYLFAASGKDCLACKLPACEAIGPDGETVMAAADACAKPYEELSVDSDECSQECISYAGVYLTFAVSLIVIAVIFMIAMAVYSTIKSSKKTSKTTIFVVAFVIIAAGVAFLLSSDTIPTIIGFDGEITKGDVKLTDTLLYATYFLLGGAVLSILSSFVIKFLRK